MVDEVDHKVRSVFKRISRSAYRVVKVFVFHRIRRNDNFWSYCLQISCKSRSSNNISVRIPVPAWKIRLGSVVVLGRTLFLLLQISGQGVSGKHFWSRIPIPLVMFIIWYVRTFWFLGGGGLKLLHHSCSKSKLENAKDT